MVNKIWAFFLIIGIIFLLFTNNIDEVNLSLINGATKSLDLIFKILPMICLWTGIMNIAYKSGLLIKLSNRMEFLFRYLFPDIPKSHPALSFITSNIIINMFGLGSAATPFGLKAMNELQKLNEDKEVASNDMITFLVLNTSGTTLIPTTVISLRIMYGSTNPTEIILVTILATLIASIVGVMFCKIMFKLKRG